MSEANDGSHMICQRLGDYYIPLQQSHKIHYEVGPEFEVVELSRYTRKQKLPPKAKASRLQTSTAVDQVIVST